VAIASALQLEAARRHASLFTLSLRGCVKFEVAEPIHCRIIAFLLLIYYFTLWPWPLTLNICSAVMKLCQIWTQSSYPRRSY